MIGLTIFAFDANAQGKFFGGDSPGSYSGASVSLGVALYVDYIHIAAQQKNNTIVLSWATATEVNNDRFEVQKMFRSNEFVTLGSLKGNGSTNLEMHYRYQDHVPLAGSNYYRIRQVDFDGKESFSETISVIYMPPQPLIYPNPATTTLHISYLPEKSKLNIYSLDGKINLPVESSKRLNIERLENGHYFLLIRIPNQKVISTRFVKSD